MTDMRHVAAVEQAGADLLHRGGGCHRRRAAAGAVSCDAAEPPSSESNHPHRVGSEIELRACPAFRIIDLKERAQINADRRAIAVVQD